MTKQILCMGSMYMDINTHHFPLDNGLILNKEIVGSGYEVVPGGSALNFARVCAALGLQPKFIGKMGDDTIGTLLKTLIEDAHITPTLITDTHVQTNISVNYTSDEGDTIMTVVGTANQSLTGAEVLQKIQELQFANGCVYFGGCFKLHALMEKYDALASEASKNNNIIIVDHGRFNNAVKSEQIAIIKTLIAKADYYLPSREEFCQLWETDSIEEGIKKVIQVSKAKIMVKDSINGVYGYNGEKIIHVPAFSVNAINLIGAGDSCNAGFICAQLEGESFEESLRFACGTAALKISREKLPTKEEIVQYIN